MVVSVVTRGVSDDCNSFVVDGASVWLRIARVGPAFAFHASTDGVSWSFIRHFALEAAATPSVGFAAQSPTGDGCAVTFERIASRRRGSATCGAACKGPVADVTLELCARTFGE